MNPRMHADMRLPTMCVGGHADSAAPHLHLPLVHGAAQKVRLAEADTQLRHVGAVPFSVKGQAPLRATFTSSRGGRRKTWHRERTSKGEHPIPGATSGFSGCKHGHTLSLLKKQSTFFCVARSTFLPTAHSFGRHLGKMPSALAPTLHTTSLGAETLPNWHPTSAASICSLPPPGTHKLSPLTPTLCSSR